MSLEPGVVRLTYASYAIPLVQPLATASATRAVRRGVIVELTTADGATGLGEAAPLPERGAGSADDVASILERATGVAADDLASLAWIPRGASGGNAARCAIETALLDIEARRRGIALATLLRNGSPVADTISTNATVFDTDDDAAHLAVQRAIDAGFSAVKVKVGVHGRIDAEQRRIERVLNASDDTVELRLDANGAWDARTAIGILRPFRGTALAFVEQPVPANDLAGLAHVRRESGVRIAGDESLSSLARLQQAIDHDAIDVAVIKPLALTGPREGVAMVRLATERGIPPLVTSTVDSGLGVMVAAHCAATRDAGPACGLSTADLLADDLLVDSPVQRAGEFRLSAAPGIGVQVHWRADALTERRSFALSPHAK